MFRRRNIKELLDEVFQDYQEVAGSDIQQLRERIHPTEVWRFFIEKPIQKHGRKLSLAPSFIKASQSNSKNVLNMTLNEFIEKVEKIDFSDPKKLKQSKLWRELRRHHWDVDEKSRNLLTLNNVLTLDKGWVPFEIDEPGYTCAMVRGFQQIFNVDKPLELNWILNLHLLATTDVEGTNYDSKAEKRGEVRSSKTQMSFLLKKNCASKAGIKEFLERNHPDQFIELKLFEEDEKGSKKWLGSIDLNGGSLEEIRKFENVQKVNQQRGVHEFHSFSRLRQFCQAEIISDFIEKMKTHPVLRRVIGSLGETKNNEEAAEHLYHWIELHHKYIQLFFISSQEKYEDNLSEKLTSDLNNYINTYLGDMEKKTTRVDKLRAIVSFVQASALLHPFHDANGRTFCMLLLNHLLIRQGFPLAILNDSNHFNLYSQDEMLREVVIGMTNTMKLIKEGKLFDVMTQDIVRDLKSNANFKSLLDYFSTIVALEEKNRRIQRLPKYK